MLTMDPPPERSTYAPAMLHSEPRPGLTDFDNSVVAVEILVDDGSEATDGTVVDHGVEPTVLRGHCLDSAVPLIFPGDVECDREMAFTVGLVRHEGCARVTVDVGHHDHGPFRGQTLDDRGADSSGCPGDQNDLVLEAGLRAHHSLLSTLRPPTSIAAATPIVVTAVISSAIAATSG